MIPFTKMHGIGNDYVYVDVSSCPVPDPASLARQISDRHFGVGADGLILLGPPDPGGDAHLRMRIFNADGSEAQMCGNGIRCACKYAFDRGLSRAKPMRIQTVAGVLDVEYETNGSGVVTQVTVDMGRPRLGPDAVGADIEAGGLAGDGPACVLDVNGASLDVILVSTGNPHAIAFVDDPAAVDLEQLGPRVETHPAFPQRINLHVVRCDGPAELTMRTWERGSGITLGCGTGASAVCVAAAHAGRAGRAVLVHLPGGDLRLRWDAQDDRVYMTGPAAEVFSGAWPA
ncbi:MAG: diaminopimelate epimerase [Planctomycetota bacterium]